MLLIDMTLSEFNKSIASSSPAPGGGSVAATCAAMGIGLTKMVALLTTGKKKYAEHDALIQKIIEDAETLHDQFIKLIDLDTEAYNGVSAVFSMPKETDDEKSARSAAMQAALKNAAKVPLDVMNLGFDALKLTQMAVGKTNVNAASDLGVAALNLDAAVKSAWLNVLINIAGIKDNEFVSGYRQKGQIMVDHANELAHSIYQTILKDINP